MKTKINNADIRLLIKDLKFLTTVDTKIILRCVEDDPELRVEQIAVMTKIPLPKIRSCLRQLENMNILEWRTRSAPVLCQVNEEGIKKFNQYLKEFPKKPSQQQTLAVDT